MEPTTYGVYVIQLDRGPHAVYVGSTAKPFHERLAQHNEAGRLAARIFRRGVRGVRLREDLHRHLGGSTSASRPGGPSAASPTSSRPAAST